MLHRLTFTALLVMATVVLRGASPADVEGRITQLISRMTLDEEIGQMSQSTSLMTPLSDAMKDEIRHGRWGSFLNAGSPADRAEAQRIAIDQSRLHIPLLFGRDVIHGYRTIFPIPLGQAAAWDPEMVTEAARIAAREAAVEGIRWTFAPMVDITRDPRWGRVAEGLGEDPYLAGVLAAAMIRGFQGDSLSAADAIAACAKHYVGYGAAEGGREYNSTWIPEVLLRDVYLRPFRAARQADAATFMTGFNALNGVPASGNQFTLRQILRGEWKFDGVVVSDYTSIPEMVQHGYAADDADAARLALLAGVDMEMVSTTYFEHLRQLLASGAVKKTDIDNAVRDILRLKFRLGLFDRQPVPARDAVPTPAALDAAKRLAAEGLVLLKNEEGTLPLMAGRRVAVIGPLADSPIDQMGTWVMDGRAEDVQTPLAALRRELGQDRVLYSPGLKDSRDTNQAGFASALETAKAADVVLLFLGEEQTLSGEAHSRAFLGFPGAQEALVSEIAKAGKPMVAIILAGRPLTFASVAAQVKAILYAWHPGTMGGPAIADVLLGKLAPSGKLPITFPRTVGQVPIYYAHLNTGRPAPANDPGIPMGTPLNPIGYTSKYLDVDTTPAYPFGYGLSFTTFEYSDARVSTPVLPRNGRAVVSAHIKNSGTVEADEIVQLYTHEESASVSQPVRELKGFRRIHLKPGETALVQFPLTQRDLMFYNSHMQEVAEPGKFRVWIAPDSVRGVETEFRSE